MKIIATFTTIMTTVSEQIIDSYASISQEARGSYKELSSKFLAFAFPVESEEQIREHLQALRKEYFDAKHHCYAWRLGADGSRWRANDDGEPSSSAGKPIYGQLLSRGLSDILVVVVRYFGGTKLGIPGLIRAYKTATADALDNAVTVQKTATRTYTLRFGYERTTEVMKSLKDQGLAPFDPTYDSVCTMSVRVPLSRCSGFEESMGWAIIDY